MQQHQDFAVLAATEWSRTLPELSATDRELATIIRLSRVAAIQQRLDSSALRGFADTGVKGTEDFRVIALLRRSTGGLTNSQLLEQLGGSKAGISTRLERLRQHGITERLPSKTDRRSHRNLLTSYGEELADRLVAEVVTARKQLIDDLPKKQVQALTDALGDILAKIDPVAAPN